MLSEVLAVLLVQGRKRQAVHQAAIREPLAGRGRPRPWFSADIRPSSREITRSESSFTTPLSQSSSSARARRPQLRTSEHRGAPAAKIRNIRCGTIVHSLSGTRRSSPANVKASEHSLRG